MFLRINYLQVKGNYVHDFVTCYIFILKTYARIIDKYESTKLFNTVQHEENWMLCPIVSTLVNSAFLISLCIVEYKSPIAYILLMWDWFFLWESLSSSALRYHRNTSPFPSALRHSLQRWSSPSGIRWNVILCRRPFRSFLVSLLYRPDTTNYFSLFSTFNFYGSNSRKIWILIDKLIAIYLLHAQLVASYESVNICF